jgi:mycoredoxin
MNNGVLIVYGHDLCGQSQLLKRALHDHHIEHEWRDVLTGDPRFRDELEELARGNLSVPTVIFPDGTVIVEPRPSQVLNHLQAGRPNLVERLLGWTRLV